MFHQPQPCRWLRRGSRHRSRAGGRGPGTFNARAGEESKLFGSITAGDIAEKLNAEGNLGFVVDRRQIELEEPIKSLGVFSVPVKLHGDVRPEIKVWVIKEE